MDIKIALQEYGLSEKEADIYIALLPLGSVTLQNISGKLIYPRTTAYNTLNYLISKGLVSYIVKKGTRYYEAQDPEKLMAALEEKKQLIKSVLPSLKVLRQTKIDSSSVQIFQGSKGVFTILTDVFNNKQTTYYFGSYSLSLEALKHLPEASRTMRMENKIIAKIVIDPYDEPIFHKKEYKKITDMRFNPALKDFPCMIFIYGKKVALYTLKKDLVGLIIDNEQVAESMKMIFDIYWNNGKKKS